MNSFDLLFISSFDWHDFHISTQTFSPFTKSNRVSSLVSARLSVVSMPLTMTKGHHRKCYPMNTLIEFSLASSRVAARRYFYCLFTAYLYASASISGTKIFLDEFAWRVPRYKEPLPSAISVAWLRSICDIGQTDAVHSQCHQKIWHDFDTHRFGLDL